MRFEEEVAINAPRRDVWAFLWNVEQLVSCVPGCREARTVEEKKRYTARVGEKIGPIKVDFPLEIEVLEMDEPRRLVARAAGKDPTVGSSIKIDLSVDLAEAEMGGTGLHVAADVTILGKLGTLGHGPIKRRATEIVSQFADAIRQRLERGRTGDAKTLRA